MAAVQARHFLLRHFFSIFKKCFKKKIPTGVWVPCSWSAVMQRHKHVWHMWVKMRCVCVCVCVCLWAWMCGCVWQIYDAGPELWCSQHPFIICHLTTHEIHGITSPLPFRVKFSPFLPSFFPPVFLFPCGSFSAASRVCACAHTHTHTHTRAQRPIHPCPPHPILTPSLPLFCVSLKGAGTEGKQRGGRGGVWRNEGAWFKCFHSCLEHVCNPPAFLH